MKNFKKVLITLCIIFGTILNVVSEKFETLWFISWILITFAIVLNFTTLLEK